MLGFPSIQQQSNRRLARQHYWGVTHMLPGWHEDCKGRLRKEASWPVSVGIGFQKGDLRPSTSAVKFRSRSSAHTLLKNRSRHWRAADPHRTIPTVCGAFFDLAGVICWSHAVSLSRFAHQHV
jgi:hypothetical protein